MDGATSQTNITLEGQLVKIVPFMRGYFPRTAMFQLWQAIEQDGTAHRLFWEQREGNETMPVSTDGDLVTFVDRMNKPATQLLIGYPKDSFEIMGMFWFSDIQPGHQAFANIWVKKSFYGKASRDLSKLCLAYAFEVWGLQQLWVTTPWVEALKLATDMGFAKTGLMPNFVKIQQILYDVHLLQLTRDAWEAWHGLCR